MTSIVIRDGTNDLPQILTQPQNSKVGRQSFAHFSVYAEGPGSLIYQWQRMSGGVWTKLAEDGTWSGVTSSTMSFNSDHFWQLNGTQIRCVVTDPVGSTLTETVVLSAMQAIPVIADFDRDGNVDLLWRHLVSASLGPAAVDYQIVGAVEFQNDHAVGLLWRDVRSGEVFGYTYGGVFSGSLGAVSLDWQAAGTGDFNHDGGTDLLWRNALTGEVAVWFFDRGTFAGSVLLDWRLQAPATLTMTDTQMYFGGAFPPAKSRCGSSTAPPPPGPFRWATSPLSGSTDARTSTTASPDRPHAN